MGEVWIVEQREPIRRTVAMKVIKVGMDTRQVVARFDAERQALAVMDHPAIAKVFDAGATPQGRPYFVMEYVKGKPITAYCDRQRLPMADRLALFQRVCEGVQHAHQKGIIHRDLKPSNVLVTIQDGQPVPKIIDFGIAKATGHQLAEQTIYTELGVLIGTPEYMSPEQAEMGGLDIDTRTDIYSLGVLLYELLTGTLPFEPKALREKALDEIRRAIRETDPPRPSTRVTQLGPASREAAKNRLTEPARLASQLRGDLDWITMKALEKDRTRRYDSVNGLAADIQRHLRNEAVTAGPPSAVYRARKFVRRHRLGVVTAATLVLLLMVFAAAMAAQAQRIARERDRANREAIRATQEALAAKRVTDFLVGLFAVSDPGEARGNSVTAREILDSGAAQIRDKLRDQPTVQSQVQFAIGSVYEKLGLYREARALLEEALTTRRAVFGAEHVTTLSTMRELANVHYYEGEYGRAESLYRQVLDGRVRALGTEHPDTMQAQFDLASVYWWQSRWKEAEQLMRVTIDAQSRILGEAHPDTMNSLSNLGALYMGVGRWEDALPIAIRVLDNDRRNYGPTHPDTLLSSHNLANVYARLGRFEEAEPLYVGTLSAKRQVLGEGHDSTCTTALALAVLYQRQRRYSEAEDLERVACRALSERFGPSHARTHECVRSLVELYEAWGKPDKAAEWRKKLSPTSK